MAEAKGRLWAGPRSYIWVVGRVGDNVYTNARLAMPLKAFRPLSRRAKNGTVAIEARFPFPDKALPRSS